MFFNEGKFYEYMCTTSIEFVVVIVYCRYFWAVVCCYICLLLTC